MSQSSINAVLCGSQERNIKVPEVVVGRVKKNKKRLMCWEGGAVNSKQGGDDIHKGTAWWLSQGPWGGEDKGQRESVFTLYEHLS